MRGGQPRQLTRLLQGTGQAPPTPTNLNAFRFRRGRRAFAARELATGRASFFTRYQDIYERLDNCTQRAAASHICAYRRNSSRSWCASCTDSSGARTPRSSTSPSRSAQTHPCHKPWRGMCRTPHCLCLPAHACPCHRPTLSPGDSERLFALAPAPLGSSIVDVCEPVTSASLTTGVGACPYELWLALGTHEEAWAGFDKFTLRVSWPASVSCPAP